MFIPALLSSMTGRIQNQTEVSRVPGESQEKQSSGFNSETYDKVSLTRDSVRMSRNAEKPASLHKYSSNDGKKAVSSSSEKSLEESEQKEIKDMEKREEEVKQHEAMHKASGTPYTSAPTYEYVTGPDGKKYINGGKVNIDTSPEDTPEETIKKARIIKKAALAPKDPSAQDRQVAAQAAQMEAEALSEKSQEDVQNKDSELSKTDLENYRRTMARKAVQSYNQTASLETILNSRSRFINLAS